MKPPPFDYIAVTSLDEALGALADGGEDAKVLAGGQSLIPLMSLRLARPSLLVDITRVAELADVTRHNGTLSIGATVRHRQAERSDVIAAAVPLIAEAMPHIGHVAIRTRGTIGGSLSHADPAAELPAVALALDAHFSVRSRDRGERTIPAADFFQGYFTTALEPDELLTSVSFPVAGPGSGFALEEIARRHGDFAMVGAAVALTVTSGTITDARIALINASEVPLRATTAEQELIGAPISDGGVAFADAAAAATNHLEPSGDLHASPAYRRKVAAVCVRRGLERALSRALEQS